VVCKKKRVEIEKRREEKRREQQAGSIEWGWGRGGLFRGDEESGRTRVSA